MVLLKLKISKKYRSLFPRPSKETYNAMKEDIQIHGQHVPIYHNKKGIILDGYTRLNIVKELGRKPLTELKDFDNEIDELDFIFSLNLQRRDLNPLQKFEVYQNLYFELRKKSLKFQSGSRYRGKASADWTNAIISKKTGVPYGEIDRIVYLKKYATEQQLDKVRNNEMKIGTLHSEIRYKKKLELEESQPEPPVIVLEESTNKQRITCPECGGIGKVWI